MDQDEDRSLSPQTLSNLDEIHEWRKGSRGARSVRMDLPLTSPAILAFVQPGTELAVAHLAVSLLVTRFAHIPGTH